MPKLKTHRGAKKRLHLTGTGTLKRRRAYVSHNLEHKGTDRKREKHGLDNVSAADRKRARRLIAQR